MPVTYKQVKAALMADEPEYGKLKRMGRDALPHLKRLVGGKDVLLASKAASLAGAIAGSESVKVLERAAGHGDLAVRAAAAYGLAGKPAKAAEPVLLALLDDPEPAVVQRAATSAARAPSPTVQARLSEIRGDTKAAPFVRAAARHSLRELKQAGASPAKKKKKKKSARKAAKKKK